MNIHQVLANDINELKVKISELEFKINTFQTLPLIMNQLNSLLEDNRNISNMFNDYISKNNFEDYKEKIDYLINLDKDIVKQDELVQIKKDIQRIFDYINKR